jgi:hypothetical protein
MPRMKRKGGHKDGHKQGRGQRPQRPGGYKSPAAAGPHSRDRRRGPSRAANHGPTVCPMCGEPVTNLSGHIRMKHDDPASHPRD